MDCLAFVIIAGKVSPLSWTERSQDNKIDFCYIGTVIRLRIYEKFPAKHSAEDS